MSRRPAAQALFRLADRHSSRPFRAKRVRRSLWQVLTAERDLPAGYGSWALVELPTSEHPGDELGSAVGATVVLRPGDLLAEHPLPSECLLVAERAADSVDEVGAQGRLDGGHIVVDRIAFKSLDLSDADLRGLVMEDADLSGAVLVRADLRDAAMTGSNLSEADLTEADLRRAALDCDLSRAVLISADLREASLEGASLSWADLSGAELSGAGLDHADLERADLQGANLRGASLCCDFRMARLEGADFSDTDPWSSIFDFATSDSSTTWPPGFEPDDEDMVDYDDEPEPEPTPVVERRPGAIRAAAHRARQRRPALQRSGRRRASGGDQP